MKLQDSVWFVTGGASGLGEAVVRRVLEQGARGVLIADLNEERGAALVAEFPGRTVFHKTNVVKEEDVQAAIDLALSSFGGVLHGVANCAGVAIPQKVISRGKAHPLDSFAFVVNVNLLGSFNVLRLAALQMSKQGPAPGAAEEGAVGGVGGGGDEESAGPPERGVIINVASVAAFEGQIGQAGYSASKGGVVAMTLPIARELCRQGIRVNCVAPGLFMTPMMRGLPAKAKASLIKQVPFPKRLGRPEEFARLIESIATNQYLNGTVLRIDGSIRMSAM